MSCHKLRNVLSSHSPSFECFEEANGNIIALARLKSIVDSSLERILHHPSELVCSAVVPDTQRALVSDAKWISRYSSQHATPIMASHGDTTKTRSEHCRELSREVVRRNCVASSDARDISITILLALKTCRRWCASPAFFCFFCCERLMKITLPRAPSARMISQSPASMNSTM
jgi:hypothetical protein